MGGCATCAANWLSFSSAILRADSARETVSWTSTCGSKSVCERVSERASACVGGCKSEAGRQAEREGGRGRLGGFDVLRPALPGELGLVERRGEARPELLQFQLVRRASAADALGGGHAAVV